MKISEAKTCLSIQLEVKHRLGKDFEAKALKLGIEALKCIEEHRAEFGNIPYTGLPSETK